MLLIDLRAEADVPAVVPRRSRRVASRCRSPSSRRRIGIGVNSTCRTSKRSGL